MSAHGAVEPPRIDTRGLRCPWPVLRAARAMREAGAFLLLADDPVALSDIPILAETHGWSLIVEHRQNHFAFHLKAGHAGQS